MSEKQNYKMDREQALFLAGFYSGVSEELQEIKNRFATLSFEDSVKEKSDQIMDMLSSNIDILNDIVISICEDNDITVVDAFNELPYKCSDDTYMTNFYKNMFATQGIGLYHPVNFPNFKYDGITPNDTKEENK